MAEQFNIKSGIINSLKAALKDDGFITAVFDMLLGRKGAAQQVEFALRRASQEQTLNEVVSVHRLYKKTVNEGVFNQDTDKKGLMRQLKQIRGRSSKFMRKVLIRTLKEKGMVASLLYIIKAIATPGYPLDDLLAAPQAARFVYCLIKNAIEVAEEEDKVYVRAALSESVEDSYGGRMPVNAYVGRFQPFHLGHISCLEKAAEYGLRTVICHVEKGSTKSAGDHPFAALDNEIFRRLKEAYPDLIADEIPVKNAFIEFWLYPMRERGFEPITWTTGQDRVSSYQSMVDKYREKYELSPNFKILPLDKNVDGQGGSASNTSDISGTRVRECLMNDDREGFQRQMPECLWDMYDDMRQAMMGDAVPAQAAALTEDEIMKRRIDEAIERLVMGNK